MFVDSCLNFLIMLQVEDTVVVCQEATEAVEVCK